jgi:dienelactone hydrolase
VILKPDETFLLRGADGEVLAGDLFHPRHEGRAPFVLVVHGFKGFKHWGFLPFVARSLAEAGFLAATVSLSHCGLEGEGDIFNRLDLFERDTWGKRLFDLRQVLDAAHAGLLSHRPCDPARIGLVGHSAGGGLAILGTAKDPRVRALATIAAIRQPNRFPQDQVSAQLAAWGHVRVENYRTKQPMRVGAAFFDELREHPQAFDIRAAARSLTVPWLLVHGVQDDSVPFEEAIELLDCANEGVLDGENARLLSLENADHALGTGHPMKNRTPELIQACDAIVEHFRRGFNR